MPPLTSTRTSTVRSWSETSTRTAASPARSSRRALLVARPLDVDLAAAGRRRRVVVVEHEPCAGRDHDGLLVGVLGRFDVRVALPSRLAGDDDRDGRAERDARARLGRDRDRRCRARRRPTPAPRRWARSRPPEASARSAPRRARRATGRGASAGRSRRRATTRAGRFTRVPALGLGTWSRATPRSPSTAHSAGSA